MVMFISCAGIIALFYIQFILYKMGKQKNFKEFIKSQQLWNVIKELLVIILGVTLAINFTSAVEERETKEKVIKMLDSIDLEIQTEYDLCKILREDYLAGEIDVDKLALKLTHNTAFSEIILTNDIVVNTMSPNLYVEMSYFIHSINRIHDAIIAGQVPSNMIRSRLNFIELFCESIQKDINIEKLYLQGKISEKELEYQRRNQSFTE